MQSAAIALFAVDGCGTRLGETHLGGVDTSTFVVSSVAIARSLSSKLVASTIDNIAKLVYIIYASTASLTKAPQRF